MVRGCGGAGVEAAARRRGCGASASGGRASAAGARLGFLVLGDEVVEGHVEGAGHPPYSPSLGGGGAGRGTDPERRRRRRGFREEEAGCRRRGDTQHDNQLVFRGLQFW